MKAMRDERSLSIAFAHEMAAFGLSTRAPRRTSRRSSPSRPPTCGASGKALALDTTFFLTSESA